MKLSGSMWSSLCAGLLPIVMLVGCGSDADPAAPGGGTDTAGGSAGQGGSAGAGGGAGKGTAGGAGGAAGSQGGSGGAAAGTAGMSAGGTAGASGEGGAAGSGAGAAGASAGGSAGSGTSPPGLPATCEAAHGGPGCCFEGDAYYYASGEITKVDCKAQMQVCSWTGTYYDCADTEVVDPDGKYPLACGGANIDGECPTGAGGSAGAPSHNEGECCAPGDGTGCKDSTVEMCVCTQDSYCCDSQWDSFCVGEVEEFGCGFCSPACVSNAECTDPDKPSCDPAVKHCVECSTNGDCVTAEKGNACDTKTHTCVECSADADCASSASGKLCDTAASQCVECKASADCAGSPGGKVCNAQAGKCVQCAADADCSNAKGTPLCGSGGKCVPNCCAGAEGTGCAADTTIEMCVCAADSYCCDSQWDSACASEVVSLGCGYCTAPCVDDADCSGSPSAPACDPTAKHCVECAGSSDCAGNKNGPVCEPKTHTCLECIEDGDCAQSAKGKVCNSSQNACVECKVSADCAGSPNGKACDNLGKCVVCTSDFDCADPTAPACVEDADTGALSCGAFKQCAGDDASEDADDGPSGATELLPSGDTNTIKDHKICDTPAEESDYYKFTAADGDNVELSVTWADTAADIDIFVTDAAGRLAGLNFYQTPATVKLTYLPKGTYFVKVSRYGGASATTATAPYDISINRTAGNKCAAAADCAAEFTFQTFRGSCNAATGACEFINGKGEVGDGGHCDAADDCKSGSCSYTPFMKGADKAALCTTPCSADSSCKDPSLPLCTSVFTENHCTAKCTTNLDCPADLNSLPEGDASWAYLVCDAATGNCSLP
jgi:hypothetical protein